MVSADGGYSNGTHTGAVWVYEMNGQTTLFEKTQILLPTEAEAYGYFGWPLALEGDVAVIAANEDDDAAPNAGAAYVYRRNNGTGRWEMEQKLTASDAAEDDLFGERLTLCEQGIIVSAFRKQAADAYDEVGAAYFFQYENGEWVEAQQIVTIEKSAVWYDYIWYPYEQDVKRYTLKHFGWSMKARGDTLLITGERGSGSPNFVTSRDRPVVYQFNWDPDTNQWLEQRVLCATDTDSGTGLGIVYNFGVPLAITE